MVATSQLLHHHRSNFLLLLKGFYSILLQGVVDAKCKFWDYDFGWVGCCHDCTLFQKSKVGKKMMKVAFLPYKLIGDATYSMRPWFYYSSFKGEKEGLPRTKHIGTSYSLIPMGGGQMMVEMAFGVLKGWWMIILKRLDTPL